jgi:hypothetical protein
MAERDRPSILVQLRRQALERARTEDVGRRPIARARRRPYRDEGSLTSFTELENRSVVESVAGKVENKMPDGERGAVTVRVEVLHRGLDRGDR